MNISVLNGSIAVSADINLEAAAENIAENAADFVFRFTKYVLDKAIADSRQVVEAGRQARQRVNAAVSVKVVEAQGNAEAVYDIAEQVVDAASDRVICAWYEKVVSPVAKRYNKVMVTLYRWEYRATKALDVFVRTSPVRAIPVNETLPEAWSAIAVQNAINAKQKEAA